MKKGQDVRVRKIDVPEDPEYDTPTYEEYIPGGDTSVPIEYEVRGELVFNVQEGLPIYVNRYERNGKRVGGMFCSSPVEDIEGSIVTTNNSVYEIT